MRKKKQEYLQFQRQQALQKMHEQEADMRLRQEQAKQNYLMQQQQQQQQQMSFSAPMYASQQQEVAGLGQQQDATYLSAATLAGAAQFDYDGATSYQDPNATGAMSQQYQSATVVATSQEQPLQQQQQVQETVLGGGYTVQQQQQPATGNEMAAQQQQFQATTTTAAAAVAATAYDMQGMAAALPQQNPGVPGAVVYQGGQQFIRGQSGELISFE